MNFSETFGTGPFAAVGSSPAKGGFDFSIPPTVSKSPTSSAIVIDDDQLLFSGVYKRDGSDLLISHDDRKIVIPDYFKSDARATLASRDGATLTGDVVTALTGHTTYAQATAPEPPKEIGSVQKLTGTASAIRNGVSVQLNVGDKVYKGDVLESGGASALGVTFVDGTVFNLSSNARMVLNEMVYDPNGSSNSSLLSLVQGTITFVAGQTAKNGNMRVDTPVATMGIRGTTVLVKINSNDGKVQLSVERDPDGKVGSFVVYDKTTGQIIGTVTREGDKTIISPSTTPGQQATTESVQKTYAEKVADLQLVQQVFQAFFPDVKKDPNNATPKLGQNGSGALDPKLAQLGEGAEKGTTEVKNVTIVTGGTGGTTTSGPGTATVVSPPVVVSAFGDIQAPNAKASNFSIGDQVKPDPLIIPYIANSAQLTKSETDSPIPSGFSLAALVAIDKQSGKVSYNPDDFRFLGIGQTASYEITFQAQTGPYVVTKTLAFTVDGLNDSPIYTAANFDAAVNEPLGTDALTLFMKQGELKFTDADFSDVAAGYVVQTTGVTTLGEIRAIPNTATLLSFLHLDGVTKAVGTTQGSIKETFSAPASTFDYLAQGETVNIVYTIKVTDAQGATNNATLTVIITGTNDVPTITSATTVMSTSGAVVENGALVATGSITFQDVDLSDTHTATAVLTSTAQSTALPGFVPATSQLVKFLVSVDTENTTDANDIGRASWSYTLDTALAQALAKDQIITQVYTVTITDVNGAIVTQDVTVTVTGTNDTPTIEASATPAGTMTAVSTVDSGSVTEDSNGTGDLSALGTIVFKDVDLIDTHTASFVLKSSDASLDLPGFTEGTHTTDHPVSNIGTFAIGSLANLNSDVNDIGLLGWTFTLNDSDPTLQSLAVGQKITQIYTITIIDNTGASVSRDVTIVINGANDDPNNNAPVIIEGETDAVGAVVEDFVTTTLTDSGTITFQDLDLIDAHAIPASPRAPSSVTVTNGGLDQPLPGFDPANQYVGTLTLTRNENTADTNNKGTVGWVFSVADSDPRVQALAVGQVITQNYTVTIDDGHNGIATQIITVTITGTNDAPTITSAAQLGGVTEDSPVVASGTVAFTDVDLIDGHTATFAPVTGQTSLGAFALAAVSEAAGAAAGSVGWTYTINQAAAQFLAVGETRTEVYTVTVDDGHQGTITQDVTITITGTNDAPTITSAAQSGGVTEDNAAVASGTVAFTDVDLIDGHTATFAPVTGQTSLGAFALAAVSEAAGAAAGSVGWTYTINQAAAQFLAVGETRTEVYTVTVDDGHQGTVSQNVTVTITGTNDAPTITSVAQSGGVTEDNAAVASGTVAFTDVDLIDGHTASFAVSPTNTTTLGAFALASVVEAAGAAAGSVGWTYTINQAAAQFLAVGETRTEVYTVTVDDGHQGTVSQNVTVTITGTNDAPTITSAAQSGGVTEDNAAVASGTVAFTDVDLIDGHTATFAPVTGQTSLGAFALAAVSEAAGAAGGSVGWTYTINQAAAQFLAVGETRTEVYTVTVDDGHQGTVSQNVTVTITGTNDAPTITAGASVNYTDTAGDDTFNNAGGTFAATDVDNGAVLTWGISGGTAGSTVIGGVTYDVSTTTVYGTLFVKSANGQWLFQTNDAGIEAITTNVTSSITVTVSDGIATTTTNFAINLIGANDTPVITSNGGGATASVNVAENSTAVTTLTSTDRDGSSFVYAIAGGADSGKFTINATTGVLSFVAAPNYEAPTDADANNSYIVQVSASDGTSAGLQTITVNVTDAAETFTGTAANDQFAGKGIGDTFNGLDAFDRVSYAGVSTFVSVNLAAGLATVGSVGTDTLINIEGIRGSNQSDSFDATGFTGDTHVAGTPIGFNEFEGRGGNDTIYGLTNAQGATLTRVSYVSAAAGVTVNLAAGTASGTASGDVANVGIDTFTGKVGNVIGSNFADMLIGGTNASGTVEVFEGRGGNDDINGGGGFDRADYNLDAAVTAGITVNLAAGTVTSTDTVHIGSDMLHSVEAVRGTAFADTYDATGFSGSSTNAGSIGTFNEFAGVGGDDTIIGNGNTRLSYNIAAAGVTVNLSSGTAFGTDANDVAGIGTDSFTGVNAVMGSMFADTLTGAATNDTFTGLAGNDAINGGGGFDTASYNNIYFTTGGITVNMTTGSVTGDTSTGTDTLRSIEGIQGTNFADAYDATNFGFPGYTTASNNVGSNGTFNQFEGLGGNDTITGNGNTRVGYFSATASVTADIFYGQSTSTVADNAGIGTDYLVSGVNSLAGSAFGDFLYGSDNTTGAEVFDGRAGSDFIDGRGGFDQVIYNTDTNITAGIMVNLAAGTVTGDASVGTDTLRSIESVIGTKFSDTIDATGFTTASTNAGSAGFIGTNTAFNQIEGFGGNDAITGNGNTTIAFAQAAANTAQGAQVNGVVVDLGAGTATGDATTVGSDTFTFVNGVIGSNFNDIIISSSADERLTGGGGADQFVFKPATGHDTIADFTISTDKIDLTAISSVGTGNFATWYSSHASATNAGADTLIDLDGTGTGANTILLKSIAMANLHASDFILHA